MTPRGAGGWTTRTVLTVVVLVLALAGVATALLAPDASDPSGSTTTTGSSRPAGPPGGGGSSPAPGPSGTNPAPSTSRPTPDGPAVARAKGLVVSEAPPTLAPYRRAAFGNGWDYDPASGCNTRERVLIEESLVGPVVDDRCRSSGGRWRSVYDGIVTTDPAALQIDHVVPLADAWRSGAAAWTPARREAFANDLAHPETLVAVTGSSNESKSDSTPDEWLPPDRQAWCAYATGWVDVKVTWGLTVTAAEKATLVEVLRDCRPTGGGRRS